MEFQLQLGQHQSLTSDPFAKLETWVPLKKNPTCTGKERDAVLYGEVIDHLYIVKPAFLYQKVSKEWGFYVADELSHYWTLAKLKQSPYLVLMEQQHKTMLMHHHLVTKHAPLQKNTFYLDHFFTPSFGGVSPKLYLFHKVQLKTMPNVPVLFRELS